ncbi:MAG TPA: GNAT family N-acetyltransferase, partial [Gemmatimonadota bacterium]|nr:GNAT family N-acetyltransferase [Gemmatimonadota bacterium]
IASAERKARKFEREVGPLRFEWHTEDRRALESLLEWKSRQYEETGVRDKFASPWVVELVKRMSRRRSGSFEGVVSALYHDDRPLAVHLGIRDGAVLAWWFPAYDPRWGKYSPGTQLLVRLLEAAPGRGVERVHLGQGDERYKRSFSNGELAVAEGLVDGRAWRRGLRALWVGARDLAQSTPALESPLRWFRSLRAEFGRAE